MLNVTFSVIFKQIGIKYELCPVWIMIGSISTPELSELRAFISESYAEEKWIPKKSSKVSFWLSVSKEFTKSSKSFVDSTWLLISSWTISLVTVWFVVGNPSEKMVLDIWSKSVEDSMDRPEPQVFHIISFWNTKNTWKIRPNSSSKMITWHLWVSLQPKPGLLSPQPKKMFMHWMINLTNYLSPLWINFIYRKSYFLWIMRFCIRLLKRWEICKAIVFWLIILEDVVQLYYVK